MRVLLLIAALALLLPACGNQTTGGDEAAGVTPKKADRPAAPEGGSTPDTPPAAPEPVASEGGAATTRTLVLEVEGMT